MKFVVYEVWTKATIVHADNASQALAKAEPKPRKSLNLSNWHAVKVKDNKAKK